jgi:serine/threonine-protein kinase RsbW
MTAFDPFHCQIHATLDELAVLLDALEKSAQDAQWSAAFQMQVSLVIEELVVNAITYGQQDPAQGWVRVSLQGDAQGLHVKIEDNGVAFDPFTSLSAPDITSDLDSRPIGGLGVHLVKEMTDTQRYERDGGVNRVTLLKHWPAQHPPEGSH